MGSFDDYAMRKIKKSMKAKAKKASQEPQEPATGVNSSFSSSQFGKMPSGTVWEGGRMATPEDDEKRFECRAGCGKKFYGFTDHDKHVNEEHGGEGSTGIVVR